MLKFLTVGLLIGGALIYFFSKDPAMEMSFVKMQVCQFKGQRFSVVSVHENQKACEASSKFRPDCRSICEADVPEKNYSQFVMERQEGDVYSVFYQDKLNNPTALMFMGINRSKLQEYADQPGTLDKIDEKMCSVGSKVVAQLANDTPITCVMPRVQVR